MINKIKTILITVIGIFTALFFYGKQKEKQGQQKEIIKQVIEGNEVIRKTRGRKKKVDNMSVEDLDKLC